MKSFLQVIPYPIYPPRNGGALRCFNLLSQLSKRYVGTALIYQDPSELAGLQKELGEEVKILSTGMGPWEPKRVSEGRWASIRYRWLTRTIREPADRYFLDTHSNLEKILRSGLTPDFTLLEGVGALTLAPLIRRWAPSTICILDSHNVDHVLLKQELRDAEDRGEKISAIRRRYYRVVANREKNLSRYVDAFLACSEHDRFVLSDLNDSVPGIVVPNGVDCSKITFRPISERTASKNVLFCGSLDYGPNIDGLNWFGEQVWPEIREKLKDVSLTIVGRNFNRHQFGKWLDGAEIQLIGEVDNVLPYYHSAAAAICPLRMGSGTRLKVLEAMSSGTPVVSTTLGAEGLLEKCAPAISIADSADQFQQAVVKMLSDHLCAERSSQKGREIACFFFDWDVVGKNMINALEEVEC